MTTTDDSQVRVGARLRVVRQLQARTIREVAESAGVSESFLSQVERGRTGVSIMSLQRIAQALDVNIGDLFGHNGRGVQPLRKQGRPLLEIGEHFRKYQLTPSHALKLQVLHAELDPGWGANDPAYSHGDSEELCIVLRGTVQMELDGEFWELTSGDSIFYMSSSPHMARNLSDETAEVLWIMTPPSY
jgi:transcriptional regulator with XRE-family HTH domain